MSWDAADGRDGATVEVAAADAVRGRTIALRVDGDSAVVDGSLWAAAGRVALAIVLAAFGVVVLARSPHRPGDRAKPLIRRGG